MTKEMNTVLELIQAMAEKITTLEFGRESDQSTIKNLEERNKFMGEGMDNLRAIKQTLSEELSRVQKENGELKTKQASLNRQLVDIQQACQHFKHEKSATIKVKRWMETITQLAQ